MHLFTVSTMAGLSSKELQTISNLVSSCLVHQLSAGDSTPLTALLHASEYCRLHGLGDFSADALFVGYPPRARSLH
jgi:hypothetical protein